MTWRVLVLVAFAWFGRSVAGAAEGASGPSVAGQGAAVSAEDWMARARDSQRRGLVKQALEQAAKAVELAPRDPRPLHYRAQLFERQRQLPSCEADLSRAIELAPGEPVLLLDRGILRLRLGNYAGSVTDLDKYAERRPAKAAGLWQRGISLFYLGKTGEARRQFESHRAVNPEDVENSAWHFCCVSRESGVAAARKAWLPVSSDPRVPMREIQAVFLGTLKPEELLASVESGGLTEGHRVQGRFYAHLYLALYHGAMREREAEARHAAEAARLGVDFGIMGEIARNHAGWLANELRMGGR